MATSTEARDHMKYAELIAKTHYSFLQGASTPEEMIERASTLGLHALAITDRDGVYGMPKAYSAAKSYPNLGFIVGAELTFLEKPPLILLARDRKAYGLMCRLLSASHHREAKKGEAFLGWDRFQELISEHAGIEGLVALALPRMRAPVPGERRIELAGTASQRTMPDHARLREIFEDRLYLPVWRHLDGRDDEFIRRQIETAKRFGIPLVATNDVHYHDPSRRPLQDVLTATRNLATVAECGRKLFPNAERHLKSPAEMLLLFHDLPDAIRASVDIADSCTFCPSELRYRYPSEWIPHGETAQSYLERLTWAGALKRYGSNIPNSAKTQIEHEFKLIGELGFADYFLTIWEIVDFARSRQILCQGRGSAANSIVCYCLGITAIDPVKMDLLFERFISAERGEPPDIDVDFEHERREEVIQHIYEKFGRERAAMVSAVITYRTRSAVRDIAKALGTEPEALQLRVEEARAERETLKVREELETREPLDTEEHETKEGAKIESETDSNGAPTGPERSHTKSRPQAGPSSIRSWSRSSRSDADLVEEIRGFPRHLSIHSGGFTLSADPLIETVPIEPASMQDRTIIQWDKYDLDILGLLKVDILALGMLTAIRKTLSEVGRELHEIPQDDAPTYEMIQRCDTVGVFQIESRAQMSMLGRLQPRNFYDLVVEVAIVRPGPIVGKMVHPYLKRRKGLEAADMPHPDLIPILGRTLGVPIFQEQIMKMAIVLAKFTPGEADQLRRAIGAWRSSGSVEKVGLKLKERLLEAGLPLEFVERIFEQIKGFAEYGFPESHAASFAHLAYVSSWLKCHHPAKFTAALVNSQPMGFYSNYTLIEDARRHGITVHPVHPNHSDWNCVATSSEIRLGWRVVKGLGETQARALIAERDRRPFASLRDFLARTRLRRDLLHKLAIGDSFRCFGFDQRHALWEILDFDLSSRPDAQGQLSLMAWDSAGDLVGSKDWVRAPVGPAFPAELIPTGRGNPDGPRVLSQEQPIFASMAPYTEFRADYAAYGLSTRGHPMQALRGMDPKIPKTGSLEVRSRPHGTPILCAGMVIVRQRPPTAKGTTFATLEDEFGLLDLIVHAGIHEKHEALFDEHSFLKVQGTLQRDGHSLSVLVQKLEPLLDSSEAFHSRSYF